ncbi:hypothetical protein LVD17_14515 [Fulvivirga ulvae]|uniref:hypothetical protein n=1 Tax=Fulvivirga ulvae TaxID=2904245 RepID=UPI001F35865A|nr:hypothetical protein [Fulvivirga ulvae]UII35020.1 hypothetical protein LVD17_14515 [Fulvivirga ulvae]
MKLKFTLTQKIKVIIGLAVFFLLLLATNKIDNNHFEIVKRSLTTIYKDRLVAQDYIYKLSKNLQLKMLDLAIKDKVNYDLNDSINYWTNEYAETRLTSQETRSFESFRLNLGQLLRLEQDFNQSPSVAGKQEIYQQYSLLNRELDELSEIQLKEGKRQMKISKRSISTSDLISDLEIGALILIALMINALIFIKPSR